MNLPPVISHPLPLSLLTWQPQGGCHIPWTNILQEIPEGKYMSQAIQSNSHMTMMREPVFLNKAAELTPVIRRRKTCPLNAIRLCEDPQAVHGWSMEPIDTADAYLQKSFST